MASLWNYISSLFQGGGNAPGAPLAYGQPSTLDGLPTLPQGQGSQLTGGYFDPSTLRLPGMAGGAPAPAPSYSPLPTSAAAMPQDGAPPPLDTSELPAPPAMPKSSHLGDVLDNFFAGGVFRRARESEYADQARNYNDALGRAVAARARSLVAGLPQRDQQAAALDPKSEADALASNSAYHTFSEGQTGLSGSGQTFFAPKVVTDNGRVGLVTGQGYRELGNTGPAFNADGLDARGLAPQADFNKAVPLESATFNPRGPYLPGGPATMPQLPQPGGPATAGAGPGTGLGTGAGASGAQPPRGVRNNNMGNVRALPNGQLWQGQTGVDDQGYPVFDTSQNGIRATLLNLHSYGVKHGINTVQGVVDRWSPGAPPAYAQSVAKAIGVKPGDKIDLNDPNTLGGMARAIFSFENGPSASGQPAPAAAVAPPPRAVAGLPQKGQAPSGEATMKANAYIRQLGPQEVAQRGFPPGTIVMQKPNGDVEVKQGGTAWTPKDVQDIRKGAMESQEMKQAKASLVAYDSLKRNTGGTMTGPQAYDILDTWIRTINPGAVARQGSIEAAMSEVGMPQTYLGLVQHLIGMGKLTPETQQAILDGVLPFVQGHWDQANAINQDNATAATRHGYDPRDITLPLDGRPNRYVIPGQGGGGPVQLDAKNADADYARLPPGAQFIGPDGKLRTKP